MADLSGLIGIAQQRALFRNYLTGMGVPHVAGSFAARDYRNAVRLIEKAIREWEMARINLARYADRESNGDAETLLFLHSVDHFENMVNALHRASQLLAHLKGAREAPIAKNDLLRDSEVEQIRQMRHGSEHVDGYVREGTIPEGEDLMIRPWCEGITFAQQAISYATLERWLRQLHALSLKLVDHDPHAGLRPTGS